MDWEFIRSTLVLLGINLVYALLALVIGVTAFLGLDRWFFRRIDFQEEIAKGNVAAAIFSGVLLLFVAIIIGMSLGK
jgi:uncharacterized membrane protein YjfL (UPF0719 family)